MSAAHRKAASVWSGFLLGIGGMMIFGVYHWFYVAPVVAPFIEGILAGGGVGALVGLAYHHALVKPGRETARRRFLFGLAFVAGLVPYELIGLIWGPFAEIQRPADVLPMLPLTLAGVPVVAAGAWLLTRDRRATWLMALTGYLLHFFIGGSAAHFGGRGQTLVLVLMMGAYEMVAAMALGPLRARLLAGGHSRDLSQPSPKF